MEDVYLGPHYIIKRGKSRLTKRNSTTTLSREHFFSSFSPSAHHLVSELTSVRIAWLALDRLKVSSCPRYSESSSLIGHLIPFKVIAFAKYGTHLTRLFKVSWLKRLMINKITKYNPSVSFSLQGMFPNS